MYRCICDCYFSRKQDFTQHYNQLHLNTEHSRTLSWVQSQQLNSNITSQQRPLQTFNNNIWDEFEGLDIFLKATDGNYGQNNKVFK